MPVVFHHIVWLIGTKRAKYKIHFPISPTVRAYVDSVKSHPSPPAQSDQETSAVALHSVDNGDTAQAKDERSNNGDNSRTGVKALTERPVPKRGGNERGLVCSKQYTGRSITSVGVCYEARR